jgi:hypothetical protein
MIDPKKLFFFAAIFFAADFFTIVQLSEVPICY